MKIVLPSDTTHNVTLIPRVYPTASVVWALYNEATKVTTTPSNTYATLNGETTVTFDSTFTEGDKYQIKMTEGADVIFRGKLLATEQTPQAYRLTNGLYFYE